MDWLALLQNLGILLGGGGIGSLLGYLSRNGRKRDRADADLKIQEAQAKMIENFQERIADLHKNIDHLNERDNAHQIEKDSLNAQIDDKTARIRELSEKIWDAEQETNHVNCKLDEANRSISALIEERDEWIAVAEYYKQWQCHSNICIKGNPDPEGRQPPNPKLKGQTFRPPK